MSHKPSILCLDDDAQFLKSLQFALGESFQVHTATAFEQAQTALQQHPIKAILLDYSLGTMNGHGVMDQFRQDRWQQPIIIISGVINLEMTVGFLKRRVFGFIEKPIELTELKSLLDEATGGNPPEPTVDFEIHSPTRKVTSQGQQVNLTPTEFEILDFFLKNKGQQVSRDQIRQQLWGDSVVSRHTFDTHLLNLKKKLPLFAKRLVSVYGTGYFYDIEEN